jgi:aminoglycoside 6'-N-acetyltransferase
MTRRHSQLRGRRLSAYEAAVERFAASRPGAWLFRRAIAPLDRRTAAAVSRALRVPVGTLETTGARTGRGRRTALLYHGSGDALVLVASNYGRAGDPAWLHNLRAHPHVRFRTDRWRDYTARVADAAERSRRWPAASDFYGGYRAYAGRTAREIPLVVLEPAELAFRRLRRDDFGLLAHWLAEPAVARWWNHELTPEAIERDFGPSVDGRDPTEMFLALSGDRPFGFIQRYRIDHEPRYAAELAWVCAVPPAALSIDYFVGEPDLRGRGIGARMIAALVARSWAAHPGANDVIVPVAAGNAASWRALERAGFARIAEGELEPDNPVDPPDHVIYAIRRPAG